MRVTLDLEGSILDELKKVQCKKGGALGKLVSRFLADALAIKRKKAPKPGRFVWQTQPMGALVDLTDKDAIYRILDRQCVTPLIRIFYYTLPTRDLHVTRRPKDFWRIG